MNGHLAAALGGAPLALDVFGEAPGAADDTESEEEQQQQEEDELEIDEDDKAWIEDSFLLKEQAALSDGKLPGKSLKMNCRRLRRRDANDVKKRAKFDFDAAASHIND